MTIRDSVTAWWVRAGGNPRSTPACSETLCWVCNVSRLRTLLVTAGTQNGSYYYHLYYWGRKFSPGNKNNGYYGIKRYHQLKSHRPWRSSVITARTQRHSPGTCAKLLLELQRLTSEPFPENQPCSQDVRNRRPLVSPQRLPMERGTPHLGLDTCCWKSSCKGMLQTEPYSGHNGRELCFTESKKWIYNLIVSSRRGKKKKFPNFTVLFEVFTNWIFSLQGVLAHYML